MKRHILFLLVILLPTGVFPDTVDPVFFTSGTWKLHSRRGIPLVLVHGLGNDGQKVWSPLLPVLKERHAVLTIGLPGLGRTPQPDRTSTLRYAVYTDWLIRKYFGSKKVVLTGHSYGGAVVLRHLALYPERTSRCLVINGAGILHPVAHLLWFSRIFSGRAPGPGSFITSLLFHADRSSVRIVLRMLQNNPLFTRLLSVNPQIATLLTLQGYDLRHLLLRPVPPVTFILGEDDRLVPPRSGLVLHHLLTGSRLLWTPQRNHGPMRTNPGRFLGLFRQALAGKGETAAPLPPEGPRKTDLSLKGDTGLTIRNGSYRRITITGGRGIRLERVSFREIRIIGSSVNMINCRAESVRAKDSSILMTAGRLSGKTPLTLKNALIDMAGCIFSGRGPRIRTGGKSKLVFSLCRTGNGKDRRVLHAALAPKAGRLRL